MKVSRSNKIYEEEAKIKVTFGINWNPTYHCEETELTEIIMPAVNESHAWKRLHDLIGTVPEAWINDIQDY